MRERCGAAACWVVALLCAPVCATTIVERTFDDLCDRAEEVFCGRVASVVSRCDAPTGTIHTYTTLDELVWIKGDDGEPTFTVRTLGGTVDDESLVVQGMPQFEIGRRYVLFVRGNQRVPCPLVGWHQGSFGVAEDGVPERVTTHDGQPVFAIAQGRVVAKPREGGARSRRVAPMSLEGFIAVTRDGLARAEARRRARGRR